jgi:hypothetical protein
VKFGIVEREPSDVLDFASRKEEDNCSDCSLSLSLFLFSHHLREKNEDERKEGVVRQRAWWQYNVHIISAPQRFVPLNEPSNERARENHTFYPGVSSRL